MTSALPARQLSPPASSTLRREETAPSSHRHALPRPPAGRSRSVCRHRKAGTCKIQHRPGRRGLPRPGMSGTAPARRPRLAAAPGSPARPSSPVPRIPVQRWCHSPCRKPGLENQRQSTRRAIAVTSLRQSQRVLGIGPTVARPGDQHQRIGAATVYGTLRVASLVDARASHSKRPRVRLALRPQLDGTLRSPHPDRIRVPLARPTRPARSCA